MTPLTSRESAAEYFKGLVEGALSRQHLSTDSPTAFYVVNLLCAFVRGEEDLFRPMAPEFIRALNTRGQEQRRALRTLGNEALFLCGFFSDAFRRKLVDIDYYAGLGQHAYLALSVIEEDRFGQVYCELSAKFITFVDVLNDVSEQTSCCTDRDLLRMYEKWMHTGSRRIERLLAEKGIPVLPQARHMRVH